MDMEQPINSEDYKRYYSELYATDDNGRMTSKYSVHLDADPTMNPKAINSKLAEVQAYKDRIVVVLNHALHNESHWKSKLKSLESMYDHEINMALTSDSVKGAGNAGLQKAVATRQASAVVVAKLTANNQPAAGKTPEYQDFLAAYSKKHAYAQAFLNEVKNIYSNLDSASMALTVQLKSVMVNARIGGEAWIQGDKDGSRLD